MSATKNEGNNVLRKLIHISYMTTGNQASPCLTIPGHIPCLEHRNSPGNRHHRDSQAPQNYYPINGRTVPVANNPVWAVEQPEHGMFLLSTPHPTGDTASQSMVVHTVAVSVQAAPTAETGIAHSSVDGF